MELLNKHWRKENMDMMQVFGSWGVHTNIPLLLKIVGNHSLNKTSLLLLNRYLLRAYHKDEIYAVLREHSPVLGSNILQYLAEVPEGAGRILEMIKIEYIEQ